MNKLLLSQAIALIDAEWETYEVAIYCENDKGDVFNTDYPVAYYEVYKEYYLGTYHYKPQNETPRVLKDARDFGDLVVIGIKRSTAIDVDYPFSVCVKVSADKLVDVREQA